MADTTRGASTRKQLTMTEPSTTTDPRAEAGAKAIQLDVLPDPSKNDSDRWAIVADSELPLYAGHLRSSTEHHSSRWAYPFSQLESALDAATRLADIYPGAYAVHAPVERESEVAK